MILVSDSNGIRRNYAVTVRNKYYIINSISFYKNNSIIISTGNGWLMGKSQSGTYDIDPLEIPAQEIKLKRNPTAYDGTYIVSTGKDWSGHLAANLYIPADDLGIYHASYELRNNGRILDSIWKGNCGIHLESHVRRLDDHLYDLAGRFTVAHQAAGYADLSILREDLFMENLDKLRTLAEAYYTEQRRLANLRVEDLDLPKI